ncbi:succinate dehydrogenase iron-sulfur subunit [Legionella sp. km772]|uniref:succinate dehydrogenase iron-sulfur subunit n=1 Tax=Legionella sp. km772 TaxID=2498111 RepID=UPI000F8EA554|nr:succinate dehydrogenase iron-sulfur subunit [Legionella sp. km772]RUR13001.1 succinate dehydrogenase iron-sulfur subunit [Legionella sp. km772]
MVDTRNLTLSIYRYNPEVDAKPYMKDYQLTIPAKSDPMLLTLLERLKAEQDSTITYRRSCREGVCGSDGMNINGTNGLACITHISQLKGDKIVIRPLPGFPVIRDLAVDMSQFYQQYERIEPYLQNDEAAPARERLQSPEERAQLDGLYECILCACCTSSCPSFWWNPEKFVGPAGLLQARRFLADSRDKATEHRLNKLQDPFSVFRCRTIMNCTNVCPKGLNPTQAIAKIRTQMLSKET